ncbi:acyltransferase family protein [Rhodococcoides yunnanense]|uniref:acyltransferase family protein n=1 Tax=Rhodococcoides yunnanense TaxID=278209 RepID=UPI0024820E51|nr:acyltransferase family protein [Rhodococcus yunnanensis]
MRGPTGSEGAGPPSGVGVVAPASSVEPVVKRFRPDIEGLRAIAVMLVLLWHAGIPLLPGGFVGVDVFFVISGFLMTGILHREFVERGRVSVSKFYARRARRLVPASTVVLVVAAVSSWAILPATRWWSTGLDIGSAGAYVLNWLLAATSVDYLAQDAASSPVQHFWSLSVEEQYYIAWPVILVVAAWILRRSRISAHSFMLMILVCAFFGSLAFSIIETSSDPGVAYFVTTTRIWELALGGFLALTLDWYRRVPLLLATLLGWFGFGAIFASALIFSTSTPFPGAAALLPTVGTAIVIAMGHRGGRATCAVVLNNGPTQLVGRLSYSFYLWHWPVLVVGGYVVTSGVRTLSAWEGLFLVLLSMVPAVLCYQLVEKPFRDLELFRRSTRNSLAIGAIGIAVALVAGAGLAGAGLRESRNAPDALVNSHSSTIDFGAALIGASANSLLVAGQSISPNPLVAADDNPPVYARGCQQPFSSSKPVACEFGSPDADVTVALVGDSHAAHWVDALAYVAETRGWRLLSYTKSSCALVDATVVNSGAPAQHCAEWNDNVKAELVKIQPAAVFVSNIDYQIVGSSDNQSDLSDAMARSWTDIASAGARVFVLRDTPVSKFDPPDCLVGHLDNPQICATPRDEAFGTRGLAQLSAARSAPVTLLDVTSAICPGDPCLPVIGGVMVYRDRTHLTATYSRSLGPTLDEAIPRISIN